VPEKDFKIFFAKSVKPHENAAYIVLSINGRITQMATNFFAVTAKCGHVGRGYYYEGVFYVRAENGSAAAAIVRMMPRVKHHHKDAILGVSTISWAEFMAGRVAKTLDPYYHAHSVQEQRQFMSEIADNVYLETRYNKPERDDFADKRAKQEAMRRHFRKMSKYGDYDIGA
jgi:hypothetical protein